MSDKLKAPNRMLSLFRSNADVGQKPIMCLENPLNNLLSVWANLDLGKKVTVVLATLGMFAAVLLLARTTNQKDFDLLFGGLEPSVAGEVITALEQRGAVYEVRGGAIYVEANIRDSLRMSLAGEGLPSNNAKGYELLDDLSGFGTTSQMFDAAYLRAKEGELARTILANPLISSARVHISAANSRPFGAKEQSSAAVTVSTQGASLSQQQIKALQYLIAAAVSGLSAEDVAVIDDDGGLLSNTEEPSTTLQADERATMLQQRAERLLLARVGPGNAVVELSLDTVSQTEQIIERVIDPESRIAISTDITEATESSNDSRSGEVTVASNLPDGDGAASGSSKSETNETRSLTNYEVSQTERQIVINPGAVRRMTVAVLVNDVPTANDDGSVTFAPRSEQELASLQELVASAVGLDETRGDVITLHSLPFEQIETADASGTLVSATPSLLNMGQLIKAGILAAVAIILGLFVVRPILAGGKGQSVSDSITALPLPDANGDALIGAVNMNGAIESDFAGAANNTLPAIDTSQSANAVERLRELIVERENETVQLLHNWIEDGSSKENV